MVAPMILAEALAWARSLIPAAEARLLLGHLLGRNGAWLEAHRDDPLPAAAAVRFEALVACRGAGEPVAYLLGQREFYGRDFTVTPDVLIPRPETELLVDLALAKVREVGQISAPRILDLGTGSGCIAVTLALECARAAVTAVDASPAALAVARDNGARLGAKLEFVASSWFVELAGRRFDLIVSNPPYVAAGDRHLGEGDLRFEPLSALASGADGLDDIRHIAAAAPAHLAPGGWLLLEHGYDQAEAVAAILAQSGFVEIEQHRDLAGVIRVSGGAVGAAGNEFNTCSA